MTPKEKAQELLEKFYVETITWGKLLAKKHALIAVDEIILSNPHSNPFNTDVYSTIDFWIEVKTELEKI